MAQYFYGITVNGAEHRVEFGTNRPKADGMIFGTTTKAVAVERFNELASDLANVVTVYRVKLTHPRTRPVTILSSY